MTLAEIKLPLWALEQANACLLDTREDAFEQYPGHRPDDDSTLAEWWSVTQTLAEIIAQFLAWSPLDVRLADLVKP